MEKTKDAVAPASSRWKKFWKGFGFTAGAMVWPFKGERLWAKLAVFFLLPTALSTLTLPLFPRAEKVLKEEGLDPAIVEELAPGQKIYVRRGESTFAKVHAVFDRGVVWGAPLQYWESISKQSSLAASTVNGLIGALPILSFIPKSLFQDAPVCKVYIRPKSEIDGDEFLTADQHYKFALLHEIGHCGDKNRTMDAFNREADATSRANEVLARAENSRDLAEALFLKWASIAPSKIHDSVLYLDAMRRGEQPPSSAEAMAANERALDLQVPYVLKVVARDWRTCDQPALEEVCARLDEATLDPLTKRRLDLYVDAWRAMKKTGNVDIWDRITGINYSFEEPPTLHRGPKPGA